MGRIRGYRSSDEEDCRQIICGCISVLQAPSAVKEAYVQKNASARFAQDMAAGCGRVYEDELGVHGVALLLDERVDRLYVKRASQGQGVGCALVAELSRVATQAGRGRLVAFSWPSAVTFYESMGFERAPCADNEAGMWKGEATCVRVMKQLI